VRSSAERSASEGIERSRARRGGRRKREQGFAVEVTTYDRSFNDAGADFPVWDKSGAVSNNHIR
ncbi:hypothetical protein RJ641_035148, partial [Dillenia turbinata]